MSSTPSSGPFDQRPTGELARALDDAWSFVVPDWRERRVEWLREQLAAAGVELWSYDLAIVEWLAGWEPEVVQVVAGWSARAAAGRSR